MATADGSGQGPQQQQPAPQPQQASTSSATSNAQMNPNSVQLQQQASPSPQQIQIQQASTGHNPQQHQPNQGQPMQQLLIGNPQTQSYNLQTLQHLLNQGQLIMPGNFLNPNMNMNPQIQVIKPIQNQFTHMLQPGTTSYAIPTSGTNNSVQQQYFISNFTPSSPLQLQHQQGKPGEMTKVLGAQLPQGLWASPQLFTTGGQNSFLIRGTHPEQMYIQPQMTSNATSQQFSVQSLQTGQLPNTSIAPVTSAQVQQTIQQGSMQQQQQNQPHPIQPQPNIVSIKTPANLQPKPPPLQIQPNTQQQATHQIQQQHQLQPQFQVTMTQQNPQQLQMIPQASSANIPQSISISQSQALTTTQVLQQAQQAQNPNQPRLTIIPHGNQIQNQSVQIIQQQQPQAIRPNFSSGVTVVSSQAQNSQGTTTTGLQLPQPRQKIRKSAVTRGGGTGTTTTTILPPPRPGPGTTMITVPNPQQQKQFQTIQQQQQGQLQQLNTTLTRIPVVTSSQSVQQVSHFKTINISAIQPNLPDATITPLMSQPSHQPQPTVTTQSIPHALQVFTTQVPSPNISITPAPPPPQTIHKKEEVKEQKNSEHKSETEKENASVKNVPANTRINGEEPEDVLANHRPPKAMVKVKPQVLTHVIEGFVIQEAAEPFPMPKSVEMDEPPKKKAAMSGEMGKCEMCGKVDIKAKFKKNKRFCSSQCAKGMKAAQQQAQATSTTVQSTPQDDKAKKGRGRKWGDAMDGNSTDETNSSTGDVSVADDHHMDVDESRMNPVKWGVSEVVEFVKSLPGCSEYAGDFADQEIDGQALLLLKADHLMSAIGMKLGPALKLIRHIENLTSALNAASGGDGTPQKKV